jgi:hypothetical protein
MSATDGGLPPNNDSEEINAEDYVPAPGDEATDVVPVDKWVYWPPFDSADYLDSPDISYGYNPDEETEEEPPDVGDLDLPEGAMSEGDIRDAGLPVDLPYEIPGPVGLRYADTGQQEWTPPPDWRQGLPPLPGQEEQEGEGGSIGEEPGGG